MVAQLSGMGEYLTDIVSNTQGLFACVVEPEGDRLGLYHYHYHYYTCSRGFPLTLEGFKQVYGDYDPENGVVVDSIAKCGDRNLIPNEGAGVYVAEPIVDGPVRETEILLKGFRADGNLGFLVYR